MGGLSGGVGVSAVVVIGLTLVSHVAQAQVQCRHAIRDTFGCQPNVSDRIAGNEPRRISDFDCTGPGFEEGRPEHIYSVTCSGDGEVTIGLGLDCDMDLFAVAPTCDDAASTLDCSLESNLTSEEVTVTCVAGETFFLVVEAWGWQNLPPIYSVAECSGSEGSYMLAVLSGMEHLCGEDCDDTIDNDDDGLADCDDPDCGCCVGCVIQGVCHAPGALNPTNPCEICDEVSSDSTWSNVLSGTSCDDLDSCTVMDACSDGRCQGVAMSCDDLSDCTEDSCDSSTGTCRHVPLMSTECLDAGPPDAGAEADAGSAPESDAGSDAGSTPEPDAGSDAGSDAGDTPMQADGGGDIPAVDAGQLPDATPASDASVDAGSDSSLVVEAGSSGCGCRSAKGGGSIPALVLLALVAIRRRH